MITSQRHGNTLHLTLDDGKANVLSTKMLHALHAAFQEDADAVLLMGREKVFCGGLDLNEVLAFDDAAFAAFLDLFHRTFRTIFAYERPVVVAVKGSAIAGGAILLCTGDLRLGARDTGTIGVNETRLGLSFPISAFEIVRSALDPVAGARALLLGELVNKERACELGFFHELSDALDSYAREKLADVAQVSRAAAANTKRALRADALARMDAGKDESLRTFVQSWKSSDGQARLQAVVAKMKAR